MRAFILARVRQAAIVLMVVVTLTFVLAHAAPGDPFSSFDSSQMDATTRAALRKDWGYDLPVWRQYFQWIGNFATGDFGWSHTRGRPVADVLRAAVPNTLILMLPAIVLGLVAGVALGTWKAVRRGRVATRIADTATLVFVSIPDFVVAVLVIGLFAMQWHLFPTGQMVDAVHHDSMSFAGRVADIIRHLVLPAGTLALLIAAPVSRYQRIATLGVLNEEFLRTARAKGVPERQVILRHALPNTLGPVIAICGLLLPALFAGAVFIEKIFSWPGMGTAIIDAVNGRDYALVQAVVLIGTLLVALGGAAADIAAARISPRTRLEP